MVFPLFKNFKATTIHNAFILNGLAVSLISVIAIQVKYLIDKYDKNNLKEKLSQNIRILITFAITFIIALIVYYLLNKIFGFGGGMLVN